MKPLLSLMLLALLLVSWVRGRAVGRRVPGVLPRSRCNAAGCDFAGAALEVSEGKGGLEFPVGNSLPRYNILPAYRFFSVWPLWIKA